MVAHTNIPHNMKMSSRQYASLFHRLALSLGPLHWLPSLLWPFYEVVRWGETSMPDSNGTLIGLNNIRDSLSQNSENHYWMITKSKCCKGR